MADVATICLPVPPRDAHAFVIRAMSYFRRADIMPCALPPLLRRRARYAITRLRLLVFARSCGRCHEVPRAMLIRVDAVQHAVRMLCASRDERAQRSAEQDDRRARAATLLPFGDGSVISLYVLSIAASAIATRCALPAPLRFTSAILHRCRPSRPSVWSELMPACPVIISPFHKTRCRFLSGEMTLVERALNRLICAPYCLICQREQRERAARMYCASATPITAATRQPLGACPTRRCYPSSRWNHVYAS